MHDILGSEALAAALKDANGSPGRASMVPRPPPGAHLARFAAQGREPTVSPVHSQSDLELTSPWRLQADCARHQ